MRFEDLELRPRGALRSAYMQLGLKYSAELDNAVTAFQQENRDYQKNHHELSPAEQDYIRTELADFF
jgi:hypothetical protein